jgi:hypothetical protein
LARRRAVWESDPADSENIRNNRTLGEAQDVHDDERETDDAEKYHGLIERGDRPEIG